MATTTQQIPIKYCKALLASSSTTFTPSLGLRFFDKVLYEFWGFCVNGGESLTQPGGFAAVSYPDNFQSGSTLLAAGNDGSTEFASDIFESLGVDFTSVNSGSLYGKYLVLWQPGEDSMDDSIYRILSVEDPFHIRVDVHSGGTRRLGNHPWFWARNNIKWRIVDIDKAVDLSGWGSGHYMVLNLVAASTVNPGQATPQVRYMHLTGSTAGVECVSSLTFSPSGSFNPVSGTFTDATDEHKTTMFVDSNAGTILGQASYTFIAARDFLIGHVRANSDSTTTGGGIQTGFGAGSGFHIEVPKRLYPSNIDPNPIAWMTWSNASPNQIAASYYTGIRMVGRTGTVRNYTTLVRSPHGTIVNPTYVGGAFGGGQWQQFGAQSARFSKPAYNVEDNYFITSDGLLMYPHAPEFTAGRVRLRRVRFTAAGLKEAARVGDPITDPQGWMHVSNGVLWPWDNSILPQGPRKFGV